MLHMKKATTRKPRRRASAQVEPRLINGLPDFQARMKKIFGNKKLKLSGADLIAKEREDRF
jgi:hypothetical protein